jgi:hypothetical protein
MIRVVLIAATMAMAHAQGLGPSHASGNVAVIIGRYDNLNSSSSNWGSCVTSACAGGMGNGTGATITPGSPMTLSFTSPAASNNVLFWVKPGTCDTCTWIRFEFDVTTPSGLNQKEFDSFIVTPTIDGMFGKQCNMVSGAKWQHANQTSSWSDSALTCNTDTISDGVKHHIIFSDSWNPADTSCGGFPTQHFGTITLDGVTSSWASTECAVAIPAGWSHVIGCQFQMNSGTTATLTESVDNVSCWVGK